MRRVNGPCQVRVVPVEWKLHTLTKQYHVYKCFGIDCFGNRLSHRGIIERFTGAVGIEDVIKEIGALGDLDIRITFEFRNKGRRHGGEYRVRFTCTKLVELL